MTAELKQNAAAGAPASIWKPYPAYRDSGVEWLGKVPEHWVMKRIKWIFKVINGSTPKTGNPEYWDGDIPWITPDDLGQLHSDTIYEPARRITESGYKNCGTTLVSIGSLVLSTRAPIGHLAIAGIDLCTNQGCRALVFKNNDNARYFYYQLSIARPELESWGQGSTFRELSKNKLESFELFSPEGEEQLAISLYLVDRTRKIDSLIEKKQKMIELLKEERTATINQAVTKGLNPDVPMKDSGIEWLGEIPKHWKATKLKYLTTKIGSGVTPKGGSETYLKEGIPFIRSQNVHFEGLIFDDIAYISEEVHKEMRGSKVNPNDVLLNITGASIGRCNFVPSELKEANVNQHVCIIRPTNKIITKYLYNYLSSEKGQAQIFLSEKGISREGLTFEQIGNFIITLPLIEEQELTVQFTESESAKIDRTISRIEKEIELMKEYRTALISEVVTGKIDVRSE